jgi:hypothetical protein
MPVAEDGRELAGLCLATGLPAPDTEGLTLTGVAALVVGLAEVVGAVAAVVGAGVSLACSDFCSILLA